MTQPVRPKNPQTPRKQDLEYHRAALASYERIRETAVQLRAEKSASGMSLRERIGWASVIDTCDGWVAYARRSLRKAEREARGARHGR